jgi:putative methyltransferase (TIGR04325 family)
MKRLINFFSRVQKPAKEIGTYENRLLAEVVSKKTKIFIGNDAEKVLPNLNYLALTTAYLSLSEIRTVNDFGGAAGIHYFLTKTFLPKLKSWTVIETKAMVDLQRNNPIERLRFLTLEDLTQAPSECDLLYLSSSLQYVEDPTTVLKKLMLSNPKLLLISRTPFNHSDTKVKFIQTSRLSSNGPGPLPIGYKDCKIGYEVNVPNYKEIIDLLEENYNIQWVCAESEEMFGPSNSKFKYLSILAKIKKFNV